MQVSGPGGHGSSGGHPPLPPSYLSLLPPELRNEVRRYFVKSKIQKIPKEAKGKRRKVKKYIHKTADEKRRERERAERSEMAVNDPRNHRR